MKLLSSPPRRRARSILAVLCITVFHTFSSNGSTITWGSPTTITGDGDVSTAGSLVAAFNLGDAGLNSATVNGVTFQKFEVLDNSVSGSVGNFTVTAGALPFYTGPNGYYGGGTGPYVGLSSSYKELLGSAVSSDSPYTLTISGLAIGSQYEFQWWANNSSTPDHSGTSNSLHFATAGNTVALEGSVGGVVHLIEGIGQFAIGTFSADSSTLVIEFGPGRSPSRPDDWAMVNAFQLRNLSNSVPETGKTGMLFAVGLGVLGFLFSKLQAQR